MQFLQQARAIQPLVSQWFRKLHANPEPSHYELETNKTIREALTACNIPFQTPTDNITMALVEGALPGKTVAIRCDTDALQLQELTELPYASQVPGVMHACGHDAHTAAGLAAAYLLHGQRDAIAGRVKILFQPAEEGEGGAREFIATGLVNDVDAFFALHVSPDYPTGTLLCSPGPICASTDMFKLTLHGKGGHGAYPHICVDALAAGAALVQSLQHVVTRFTDPLQSVVLSVCSFHAGTRCNITAHEAILEGTVRTFDNAVHDALARHMERIIEHVAAAHGCTVDFVMESACTVTVNDEALARLAQRSARIALPDSPLLAQPRTPMGDDFAEYAQIAPCCYGQVGIGNEDKGSNVAQHNGLFRVDEDALPICAAWMCQFAVDATGSEH